MKAACSLYLANNSTNAYKIVPKVQQLLNDPGFAFIHAIAFSVIKFTYSNPDAIYLDVSLLLHLHQDLNLDAVWIDETTSQKITQNVTINRGKLDQSFTEKLVSDRDLILGAIMPGWPITSLLRPYTIAILTKNNLNIQKFKAYVMKCKNNPECNGWITLKRLDNTGFSDYTSAILRDRNI